MTSKKAAYCGCRYIKHDLCETIESSTYNIAEKCK